MILCKGCTEAGVGRVLNKTSLNFERKMIDMFPWTSVSRKTARNPLICFHERKVQKFAKDSNVINSGHVETVVLMEKE